MIEEFNVKATVKEEMKSSAADEKNLKNTETEQGCFVCHGTGHWARECTSLPSMYLTEDAPKCYRCGGVGHFARFCPTSEKQFRHRERRASFPSSRILPDWGNYFGDLLNMNYNLQDQIFLVRPEYKNTPRAEGNSDYYEMMSDCSSVDYVVEDADSPFVFATEQDNIMSFEETTNQ